MRVVMKAISYFSLLCMVDCTCGGGGSSPTSEDVAYSPNMSPKVSVSVGANGARGMGDVDVFYPPGSPYYGANFMCSTWSEGTIVGYAEEDAHDSSGAEIYFPAASGASLAYVPTGAPALGSDLLDTAVYFAPNFDGTDCAADPGLAICNGVYTIDVRWLGQHKTWTIDLPAGWDKSDVEDITILKKGSNDESDYVLLASTGSDRSDAAFGYLKVPIPDFDAMPITDGAKTQATCLGAFSFPDEEAQTLDDPDSTTYVDTSAAYTGKHNIMAHAVDPGTGNWYFIDDRNNTESTTFYEPVVYYLTRAQVDQCNGELKELGRLPLAHWLLLYIITLEDQDTKNRLLGTVLNYIAPSDENGNVPADHPNRALRERIEQFFGLDRVVIDTAATTTVHSDKTVRDLYDEYGGAPSIFKSLIITGLDFNFDGSQFVLSTFGGHIIAWQVGISLRDGIPPVQVWMQEYLHTPIVADRTLEEYRDKVGGIAYFIDQAPTAENPLRLIISTESDVDMTFGPTIGDTVEGTPQGFAPIYMFSCLDAI